MRLRISGKVEKLMAICACIAGSAFGQTVPAASPVLLAQKKISGYLSQLADLHCDESITQEKLNAKGHVEETLHAKYDYLIMMQGSNDSFQLNESRVAASPQKVRPEPISMLISNGLPTLVLMFHPYYAGSFTFTPGPAETLGGKELVPIGFESVPGRRALAALALRGREFPLGLQGTAWIDAHTGDIEKIDASLKENLSDIGLQSLKIHVEYRPVMFGDKSSNADMPALAVVDVVTPRQHWRNTDAFSDYKSFSIDVKQGPAASVHTDKSSSDGKGNSESEPGGSKENP